MYAPPSILPRWAAEKRGFVFSPWCNHIIRKLVCGRINENSEPVPVLSDSVNNQYDRYG